mmetsp:Transcript_8295/g.11631  ORF Transcript_8295/g.11631 Transcript_8295/m.11631 type:complete len:133 (-) Transcript_8295:93-491(-)
MTIAALPPLAACDAPAKPVALQVPDEGECESQEAKAPAVGDNADEFALGNAMKQSGCTRLISPFAVRFSQMRARHDFRDGRALEEAIANTTHVAHTESCSASIRLPMRMLCPQSSVRNFFSSRTRVMGPGGS